MSNRLKTSDPLDVRAMRAMKRAVAEVVEQHRLLGLPLVVWRNGKVAHVMADDLDRPAQQRPRRRKAA